MKLNRAFAYGWLLAVGCFPASGSVIYAFTSLFPSGTNYAFTYTAVNFVTTDLTIPASELDSCTTTDPQLTCISVGILPSGPDSGSLHLPEIRVDGHGAGTGSSFYYFPVGGFTATGTYRTAVDNPGRLTITTTEPSSVVLFGAGLLFGLCAIIRRRRGRIAAFARANSGTFSLGN